MEGIFSIILNNGNSTYELEMPNLGPLCGSGVETAQSAASKQKNIDLWIELLIENIRFITNLYYFKNIIFKTQDTFVYKNRMFSSGHPLFDDKDVYIVHPYLANRYSTSQIKKINK